MPKWQLLCIIMIQLLSVLYSFRDFLPQLAAPTVGGTRNAASLACGDSDVLSDLGSCSIDIEWVKLRFMSSYYCLLVYTFYYNLNLRMLVNCAVKNIYQTETFRFGFQ